MKHSSTHSKAFIILLAGMMSLVALSVDAMLPALVAIAEDFELANPAHSQWTITSLFIGLSIGQLVYGPWSDAVGRKPPIYVGYLLFIVGSIICVLSSSFAWLIAGRVLQGMGAAAPRIITMALVRDKLKGAEMARIMSVVFSVFIVVPILAPAVGQVILGLAHWRWIFGMLLLMAIATGLGFWRGQEETLTLDKRRPLTLQSFVEGLKYLLQKRSALVYTIVSGFIFGAFMGYLNSAPLLFIQLYNQADNFALLFALAAIAVGVASLVNGRFVLKLGMRLMIKAALWGLLALTSVFCLLLIASSGVPPLWWLMAYLIPAFFCIGILFGNLNSLAMEPLGAIAGMGSAFVASISTLVAIPIGSLIGLSFKQTCYPVVIGFGLVAASSLLLIKCFDNPDVEDKQLSTS
ncbi:multidrug effflux MFS transporter [Agarivorans aestuarii]|uniref:multidrug effflux MFS transporter n=1 Tax=Agarivorans aestuarii TaxID=1563703 RepID=UPI001C7E75F5|nr:multidrug effflux MFS transporter [Agarivorans aestuarii]